MKNKVLPIGILAPEPTKQEEIAHLEDFINKLPRGSYLQQMFKEFLGVATESITNDFYYCIIENVSNTNELDNEIRTLKEAIADIKKQWHEDQKEQDRENSRIQAQKEKITDELINTRIARDNAESEIADLRIALESTNDQKMIEILKMDLENLERDNKGLYREITGHKAQIELLKEMLQEQIKRGRITTD